MHVIAISGPIGAPLEEFATGFAEHMQQKIHILNEKDFGGAYSPDHKQLMVELEKLKSEPTSSIVIVTGHFLLTNEELRKHFVPTNEERGKHYKVKIFLQYPMDLGLQGFINDSLNPNIGSTGTILNKLLNEYETKLKPKNDEQIKPSCRYADFIIPEAKSVNKEFGRTYILLKDGIQPENPKAIEEKASSCHQLMLR